MLAHCMIGFLRIRNGIKSKKGKARKFSAEGFKADGVAPRVRNLIYYGGLQEVDSHKIVQHANGSFSVTLEDFDKCDMTAA